MKYFFLWQKIYLVEQARRSNDATTPSHCTVDIGDFEDAQEMMQTLGEDILKDTIQHAEAGWFRPRS